MNSTLQASFSQPSLMIWNYWRSHIHLNICSALTKSNTQSKFMTRQMSNLGSLSSNRSSCHTKPRFYMSTLIRIKSIWLLDNIILFQIQILSGCLNSENVKSGNMMWLRTCNNLDSGNLSKFYCYSLWFSYILNIY